MLRRGSLLITKMVEEEQRAMGWCRQQHHGYDDGTLQSGEETDTGIYPCALATATGKLEPTTH